MHVSPWYLGPPVQQQLLLQRQLHLRRHDGPVSVQSRLDREELRDPVQLQQLAVRPVHGTLPVPRKTVGPAMRAVLPVCQRQVQPSRRVVHVHPGVPREVLQGAMSCWVLRTELQEQVRINGGKNSPTENISLTEDGKPSQRHNKQ